MFTKQLMLAAAALGGLAASSSALADGETKQLINNSYQQAGQVLCGTGGCEMTFPPITDVKTVITAVSCTLWVTQGSLVGFKLFSAGTPSAPGTFFLPAFVWGQDPQFQSLQVAVNATTNFFMGKGDTPAVEALVTNGGTISSESNMMYCVISGYHS